MTAVREHRSVMLLCGAFRRQRRQAGVAKTCYSFTYCTYVIAGTGPELEDALGSSRHVTRILDTNNANTSWPMSGLVIGQRRVNE